MDKDALRRRVAEMIAEQMRMYFDVGTAPAAERFEPLAFRILHEVEKSQQQK